MTDTVVTIRLKYRHGADAAEVDKKTAEHAYQKRCVALLEGEANAAGLGPVEIVEAEVLSVKHA